MKSNKINEGMYIIELHINVRISGKLTMIPKRTRHGKDEDAQVDNGCDAARNWEKKCTAKTRTPNDRLILGLR